MERALKTVSHRLPDAIDDLNAARDALIEKFREGVIGNITDFRMLSKIATSINNIGMKETKARRALKDILDPETSTGIVEVFSEQFEMRYDERKVLLSVDSIYEYLETATENDTGIEIGEELAERLSRLKRLIDRVLRRS